MPEPLLIIATAATATAAAEGIRRGLNARGKINQTKQISQEIKSIVSISESKLDNHKKSTISSLEELGKTKLTIMSTSMKKFVDTYTKLKKVNFKDVDLKELEDFEPEDASVKDLSVATIDASNLTVNGLTSLGTGTFISVAAYGSVMYGGLATASTGTLIGTLHGAAATNATLAWFGGGSLAAGGLGMTGGMVVLGGLVAGPAIFVGGWLLDRDAEKKLYEALGKKDEAKNFEAQVNKIVTELNRITDRCKQIIDILNRLNAMFILKVKKLEQVVELSGNNFENYTVSEQKVVILSAMLAKTIKIILDAPLFTEDGKLTCASKNIVEVFKDVQIYTIDNLKDCLQNLDKKSNGKDVLEEVVDDFKEGMKHYTAKRLEKAVEYFRRAAKDNNKEAQFMIGLCYERGEGVRVEKTMAIYWYSKAAEQGHLLAQKRLNKLK